MDQDLAALRTSYDRVAGAYADRFLGELAHKPLDRALLDLFAEDVRGRGRGTVGDVGCGLGQVARYLRARGLDVVGVDLSPAMVALAREHHPDLTFREGDMRALDVPDGAGHVAFYSIIHLPPAEAPRALAEFHRVLRPGGLALVAFHLGDERRHLDEWLGQPVALDFHFFARPAVEGWMRAAGFAVEARVERGPLAGVEAPTERAYLLALKGSHGAPCSG